MNSPSPTPSLGVGYSTYRSKRHSHTTSSGTAASDSSQYVDGGREKLAEKMVNGHVHVGGHQAPDSVGGTSSPNGHFSPAMISSGPGSRSSTPDRPISIFSLDQPAAHTVQSQVESVSRTASPTPPIVISTTATSIEETPITSTSGSPPRPSEQPNINGVVKQEAASSSSSSTAGPSSPKTRLRTTSTFRHIPLRSSQPPTPSPLRPSSTFSAFRTRTESDAPPPTLKSSQSATFARPTVSRLHTPSSLSATFTPPSVSRASSALGQPSAIARAPELPFSSPGSSRPLSPASPSESGMSAHMPSSQSPLPPLPSPQPSAIPNQKSVAASSANTPAPTPTLSGVITPAQRNATASSSNSAPPPPQKLAPAPYRQGFQPKGVYGVKTDEFVAMRNQRIESRKTQDKRLERRLEKLVELHFSPKNDRHVPPRRSSSFLDLSEIKGKGASELWKGVIDSTQNRTEKYIRDHEQSITHWEDDAAVSACPMCSQQFNVLSNRKHHCRLCGRVVCSLPPRPPQRTQACSILIKADYKTGRIEEVPDVIAYGVRRAEDQLRTPGSGPSAKDREAYLKGVRICRECNEVVCRQQFAMERSAAPLYARLHNAMIQLEQEIQDSLPQFHEHMQSFSATDGKASSTNHRAAMEARQNVLSAFAEYDSVAKRIGSIGCIPGSSQERLQKAILSRANLFLQQHMFPLKSLPSLKRQSRPSSLASTSTVDTNLGQPSTPNGNGHLNSVYVDQDSELAMTLQPLLEQEALIESFVEEATAARKFEDAKTLKTNLDEIRREIQRIAKGGKLT